MLAVTQVNWYSLLSTLFVGVTTTTVLWRFIQRNAASVEKRRKKYARKLARRQDAHIRVIVNDVLADHMGIEEKTIEAINGRLDELHKLILTRTAGGGMVDIPTIARVEVAPSG